MAEQIKGLTHLLTDPDKIQRLAQESPNGNLWAYTDAGLFFPDNWMKSAVEKFNDGDRTVFEQDERPANLEFCLAGGTYDSVNTGGSKSGGRIIEIDSKTLKIVSISKSGERELVYTAEDYRK